MRPCFPRFPRVAVCSSGSRVCQRAFLPSSLPARPRPAPRLRAGRDWRARRESNPRPAASKADALWGSHRWPVLRWGAPPRSLLWAGDPRSGHQTEAPGVSRTRPRLEPLTPGAIPQLQCSTDPPRAPRPHPPRVRPTVWRARRESNPRPAASKADGPLAGGLRSDGPVSSSLRVAPPPSPPPRSGAASSGRASAPTVLSAPGGTRTPTCGFEGRRSIQLSYGRDLPSQEG